MPITAIAIENFKGIKAPIRIELKPITLLFGPNSAGKSTIVQALHFAREIFERGNIDPGRTLLGGSSVDLGGFKNIVHNHDIDLPIRITLDLNLGESEDLPQYTEKIEQPYEEILSKVTDAQVEISVGWREPLNKPLLYSYKIKINGEPLAAIEASKHNALPKLTQIVPYNSVFLEKIDSKKASQIMLNQIKGDVSDANEIDFEELGLIFNNFSDKLYERNNDIHIDNVFVRGKGSAFPKLGKPLEVLGIDEEPLFDEKEENGVLSLLSSLIVGPGEMIRDELSKFCYLGPLREVPPRNFEPERSPDESRWSNGLAAWDTLHNADDFFINKVNEWMTRESRLNSGYSLEVKKYKELDMGDPLMLSLMQGDFLDEETNVSKKLKDLPTKKRLVLWEEEKNIEVLPQDVGVGISQVLPVVVAALNAKRGLVAIEQPELHIHPAFQVALGDLFIEQIKETPDLLFVLETHSEHMGCCLRKPPLG